MFSVDLNCHFFAICRHNTLQLLSICVLHNISYQRVLLTIPPPSVEVRVLLAHGLCMKVELECLFNFAA